VRLLYREHSKTSTRFQNSVFVSIRGGKLGKKESVKVGDRIQLVSIDDSWAKLKAGDTGTVFEIDEEQELLWVKWDNGQTLALIQGVDKFSVVKK
jgi:hypothetical protein